MPRARPQRIPLKQARLARLVHRRYSAAFL
jgi:hypothetical protein